MKKLIIEKQRLLEEQFEQLGIQLDADKEYIEEARDHAVKVVAQLKSKAKGNRGKEKNSQRKKHQKHQKYSQKVLQDNMKKNHHIAMPGALTLASQNGSFNHA